MDYDWNWQPSYHVEDFIGKEWENKIKYEMRDMLTIITIEQIKSAIFAE